MIIIFLHNLGAAASIYPYLVRVVTKHELDKAAKYASLLEMVVAAETRYQNKTICQQNSATTSA